MEPNGSTNGLSRRGFFKTAVAIGGASALSACLQGESADVPKGGGEPPERQHAWNDSLRRDDHGNFLAPRHHVLLLLDYAGGGVEDDRGGVEDAFESLERAYEWSNEGLLFTVGYSPYYFDRFDEPLDSAVDLPEPEPMASFENPEPDEVDAAVHLASDYASVVLEAEEALLGERERANGVELEADLTGVFERVERRTGFVGEGLPAEHQDVDGVPDDEPVPEDSPLYMGFKSGFEENQATEDDVTIEEGAFAGGTTQHASHLHLDLEQWYGQDSRYQRVSKMFCPAHAEEDRVEGVGENLGSSSGADGCPAPIDSARGDAATVGHAQKAKEEREDGRPPILRRDFDSTDPGRFDAADGERAGVHFVSLQDSIEKFVRVREAMNADDVVEESAVGRKNNNGILQYITAESRGNYLVPPRSLRALPPASP